MKKIYSLLLKTMILFIITCELNEKKLFNFEAEEIPSSCRIIKVVEKTKNIEDTLLLLGMQSDGKPLLFSVPTVSEIPGKGIISWGQTLTSAYNYELKDFIRIEHNEGYLGVGFINNFSNISGYDILVVRYDRDGKIIGIITFQKTNQEFGNAIIETPGGNFIITGKVTNDSVAGDLYISKIDLEGNILWDTIISNQDKIEEGKKIIKLERDKFLVISDVLYEWEYYIHFTIINTWGEVLWDTLYRTGYKTGSTSSVCEGFNNNILITGYRSNDIKKGFCLSFNKADSSVREKFKLKDTSYTVGDYEYMEITKGINGKYILVGYWRNKNGEQTGFIVEKEHYEQYLSYKDLNMEDEKYKHAKKANAFYCVLCGEKAYYCGGTKNNKGFVVRIPF